jgi:hypothetical protein
VGGAKVIFVIVVAAAGEAAACGIVAAVALFAKWSVLARYSFIGWATARR